MAHKTVGCKLLVLLFTPSYLSYSQVQALVSGLVPIFHLVLPVHHANVVTHCCQNEYSVLYTQPLKMELTEGSETSANHNLTPGKYPKEHIQYSKHGESLKSGKNGVSVDF
jgi:hypothetical protein